MNVSLYHRGRFHPLKMTRTHQVNHNTWTLELAVDELQPILRAPITLDVLDGAIFGLDDAEAENAIGHHLNADTLSVTVWIL